MEATYTAGYMTGSAQPPAQSGGRPSQHVTILTQTNATADHIADAVAWKLRTQ
jgi:hypothetical protein